MHVLHANIDSRAVRVNSNERPVRLREDCVTALRALPSQRAAGARDLEVAPGTPNTTSYGGAAFLKAGPYTFVIHDGSALHSFGLDGPNGFAKDFTTVPFKGTKTVTLNLKKGKYKYYCVAHESTMFGHFKVK